MLAHNLGIDVSGKELQVCLKVRDKDGGTKIKGSRKFPNNPKGLDSLVKWVESKRVSQEPMRATMEATGVYYESAAYFLHKQGWNVFVLLPNRIKGYFRFLNLKSKTDKIEADGLAELGISQHLPNWEPSSPTMYSLKGLNRERTALVDDKTVYKNRLHAEESCESPCKETIKRLKAILRLLDKQVNEVEQEIGRMVEADSDLKERIDNICKVKGLGLITVVAVIAETNGFKLVTNKSQLVSYAGYDVVERQSGTSVNGKTRISKKGNRHIRRALHFPALTVVKYHDEFTQLFNRVYDRTKIKMKGYVAVQRKLLVLIYTLYKNNQPYDSAFAQKQAEEKSRQGQMPAYTG